MGLSLSAFSACAEIENILSPMIKLNNWAAKRNLTE